MKRLSLPGLLMLAVSQLPAQADAPSIGSTAVQAGQQDRSYGCIVCHADKRRSFEMGVHSERGIRCDACHGGNPRVFETPEAHRGRFVGIPDKRATVRLCGSCHADPNQMRQYGLPSGQVAELRTSRHGQLLEQGNNDAPTCTDCHESHTVLRPEDARSRVHPTNIPATCGACHGDATLMAKYGLPTDELTRYRESAHGVGLFEKENLAAPTCIGCHGSHAALPPGITEVVNVCGHCHVLLGREFNRGPHGQATRDGKLAGCLGCHSNHGTERVAEEGIARACGNCHAPDSPAATVGQNIQTQVLAARGDLDDGAHAIEELIASGRDVSDERFRYQTAYSHYAEMAKVQHSLEVDELGDIGLRVRSNIDIIRTTAEVAQEARWEHKLFLIPVWFLALSAVLLAWFKLRTLPN